MLVVTADEFAVLLDVTLRALDDVVDDDWSQRAGTLDWTCWQTLDHTIDCIFSYAMQLTAGAQSGFLPFDELHAAPDAGAEDLIAGLRGVGTMFLAVVRESPSETCLRRRALPGFVGLVRSGCVRDHAPHPRRAERPRVHAVGACRGLQVDRRLTVALDVRPRPSDERSRTVGGAPGGIWSPRLTGLRVSGASKPWPLGQLIHPEAGQRATGWPRHGRGLDG